MNLFKRKKKEEPKVEEKAPEILSINNIRLNRKAATSDEAILSIGRELVNAGYVEEGYRF